MQKSPETGNVEDEVKHIIKEELDHTIEEDVPLEKLNLQEAAKKAPELYVPGEWLVKVGRHTFAWAPEYVHYSDKQRRESVCFGENTDFVIPFGFRKGKPPINSLISTDTLGPMGQWISTATGDFVDKIPQNDNLEDLSVAEGVRD